MIKTFVHNPGGRNCLILLPGRLGSSVALTIAYIGAGLEETALIGLEPENLEWYPLPNGAADQRDAVRGMKKMRAALLEHINKIQKEGGWEDWQIAIAGFSAGAVMTIQCATRRPFAAAVCHSGAILQPGKTPEARFRTPVLLMHNKQDDCFKWSERYKPMRKALMKKGYNVTAVETDTPLSGHTLTRQDILMAGAFLSPHLGYRQRAGHRLADATAGGPDIDIPATVAEPEQA